MQEISLGQASKFTSPTPLTVVCTETPAGKTNLAPVSWWNYLSFNPNIICFAMAKTSYSGEMVRQNKQVVLAMPGVSIADAIMTLSLIHIFIVAETRRARNMAAKAAMKTQLKKFAAAVEDGDKSAAERELLASVSILDKTASKGVIHKNAAARRKSNLYRDYNNI